MVAVISCGLSVPVPPVAGPAFGHGLLIEPRSASPALWGPCSSRLTRLRCDQRSGGAGRVSPGGRCLTPLSLGVPHVPVLPLFVSARRHKHNRFRGCQRNGPAGLLVLAVPWDFPIVMGPGYGGVSRLVLLVSWTLGLVVLASRDRLVYTYRRRSTRCV